MFSFISSVLAEPVLESTLNLNTCSRFSKEIYLIRTARLLHSQDDFTQNSTVHVKQIKPGKFEWKNCFQCLVCLTSTTQICFRLKPQKSKHLLNEYSKHLIYWAMKFQLQYRKVITPFFHGNGYKYYYLKKLHVYVFLCQPVAWHIQTSVNRN